jgi:FemAB-related protein (PEP-CTERM system-associated)
MTIAEPLSIADLKVEVAPLTRPEREQWTKYVLNHNKATLFHLPNWAEGIASAHGHKAYFLRVLEGPRLKGVMPLVEIKSLLFGHSLISAAFGVGGGPLSDDSAALSALLKRADQLGRDRGADYVEIRDVGQELPGWNRRDDLYASFDRAIDENEEKNLLQIPRKQRAVVRKALDGKFDITIDKNLDVFFDLFSRTARDHGTPVFPKKHFRALAAAFPDHSDVLTVHADGEPVSSVFSFYFNDRVMPYYTGSKLEARSLGTNDLMYWKLMRHAADRGCRLFDFGRSKVGTGPYSFKKNWGFEPRPVVHQFKLLKGTALPNVSPANPKLSGLVHLWRRLPLPVANTVSQFISPSLG